MDQFVYFCLDLGLLFMTIFAVISLFFLSRVIKIEHDGFPKEREKDGSPHGLPFWFSVSDGLAYHNSGPWSKGYRWLFKTPEWIKTHNNASRMFKYFRFSFFMSFLAVLAMTIMLFISTPR